MNEVVTAKSYTLITENGGWLGQIVLTSDGMFSAVTDWGNFSYTWRAFGESFEDFILRLDQSYFGGKMVCGLSYIVRPTKAIESKCYAFAAKILPALQAELRKEKDL
jgi:hypothetical protein